MHTPNDPLHPLQRFSIIHAVLFQTEDPVLSDGVFFLAGTALEGSGHEGGFSYSVFRIEQRLLFVYNP